jgi:hypothetical protein
MISKALNAKGIKANYESFGKVFTYVKPETIPEPKLVEVKEVNVEPKKEEYIQISIMDLVS